MLRRDFLRGIAAVGAAICGGAAATVKAATPAAIKPIVSADVEQLAEAVGKANADISGCLPTLINECRVVSWTPSATARGYEVAVSYRHDPDGTPSKLDGQIAKLVEGSLVMSVEVTTHADNLDITHLGDIAGELYAMPAARDVEVRYVKAW